LRKLPLLLPGLIFGGCFYAYIALGQYYTRNRPEAPQPTAGFVHPIDANYGKVVYVSTDDEHMMKGAITAVAISGLGWAAILIVAGRRQRQNARSISN